MRFWPDAEDAAEAAREDAGVRDVPRPREGAVEVRACVLAMAAVCVRRMCTSAEERPSAVSGTEVGSAAMITEL